MISRMVAGVTSGKRHYPLRSARYQRAYGPRSAFWSEIARNDAEDAGGLLFGEAGNGRLHRLVQQVDERLAWPLLLRWLRQGWDRLVEPVDSTPEIHGAFFSLASARASKAAIRYVSSTVSLTPTFAAASRTVNPLASSRAGRSNAAVGLFRGIVVSVDSLHCRQEARHPLEFAVVERIARGPEKFCEHDGADRG
jgi:hypothetical protein